MSNNIVYNSIFICIPEDHLCERMTLCSHFCHDAPEGKFCACPPGTYLSANDLMCTEKHRCSEWGVCSQNCDLTGNHTHRCYCDEGYIMQPDHFTCKFNGTCRDLYCLCSFTSR